MWSPSWFLKDHRAIHSINPLERLNGEIKRRTDVVAIFPMLLKKSPQTCCGIRN
jgi:transposase-like protein